METKQLVVHEENLSIAWARAFSNLTSRGVSEIVPLQVTIELQRDRPVEVQSIRDALDSELRAHKLAPSETVASTIFPVSMWNSELPRDSLFERYLRTLPSIKKFPQNRNGLYFERFIAYGERQFNQLDFIIKSRLGESGRSPNRRRSVLQAAAFQPSQDLTNQRQRGFPCLQQVNFAPYGKNQLAVNGFYATQYIFQKAYGNYLGLYDLGRFVAHELGLELGQITCFTGIAELGKSKARLARLGSRVERILKR